MKGSRVLLVGIGSPHGDDRAGWLVAQHVTALRPRNMEVRSARHPAELLDWLDQVDALVVCDAVACDARAGTCRTWTWPAVEIETAPFFGAHDLSLPATLALAAALDRLPAHVEIWGIAIDHARSCSTVSPAVAGAIPDIARRLLGACCHA
jgi:hydrogenase maturation protease